MKIFAIADWYGVYPTVAYLFYFEAEREFHIEIVDDAKPQETPFYLAMLLEKGYHSINSYYSLEWVRQRIVPEDRQNLGHILRDNGLAFYDEYRLLLLSGGRCCQDDYVLREVSYESLPECIKKRMDMGLSDTFQISPDAYLLFFKDGRSRLVDIKKDLKVDDALRTFLGYLGDRHTDAQMEAGGTGIRLSENISASSEVLSCVGREAGFTKDEFYRMLDRQLVNTHEACEILSCSRQNIDDLIRRGKLRPVKEGMKDKLFLRSDVESRRK